MYMQQLSIRNTVIYIQQAMLFDLTYINLQYKLYIFLQMLILGIPFGYLESWSAEYKLYYSNLKTS